MSYILVGLYMFNRTFIFFIRKNNKNKECEEYFNPCKQYYASELPIKKK